MDSLSLGPLAVWRHEVSRSALGRVLLVHGLSEHSGRHRNTVDALLANNFEVVRFDLRGSGQSGGRKMWISRFTDYVDDVATVFNWICGNLPKLPLFVHGHSLGGAISVYFAAHYGKQIDGLVLSAPAYFVGSAISPLKIAVGRALARFVPTLRLPNESDLEALSRDPEVTRAYQSDPLSYHFNTLQQGNEILKALDKMPDMAARLTMPLMIVHGTSDRIIRPDGSFALLRKATASRDKELHYFPSAFHEIHNDTDKEKYFQILIRWLTQRSHLTLERTDGHKANKPSSRPQSVTVE